MVETGMKDAGYEYLVIDDCWSDEFGRDKNGDLQPEPSKFPSGMKSLADYVHSKGLKFGIYSDAADKTCAGWPGSYNHEERDARLWASWGVDFLKYDYCHAPPEREAAIDRYSRMARALRDCGRPILFSVCEWGGRQPWLWAREAGGQMWRATADVIDSWRSDLEKWPWGSGVLDALDFAGHLHEHAGPGGWNDLDMLVIGLDENRVNGGIRMTPDEYRSHMSMWCLLCSPLMAGCDLRKPDSFACELLMNREVLAVNQDSLGKQGLLASKHGELEVWRKPLADGSMALCLFNRSDAPATITAEWGVLGMPAAQSVAVRDLWNHEDLGRFTGRFEAPVPAHGTVMVRLQP
jgi:alpha-galactosidase